MKKHLLSIIVILFVPLFLYGQADKIIGFWMTDTGESQIEIKKNSEGRYYGTIVWLEEPLENGKPKVDDDNPDPKLQNRPILGLQLCDDFKYSSKKKKWMQGSIYDPKEGKTYDCFAWFEKGNTNELHIKGYVMGIKALGRSTIWTREKGIKK